MKNLKKSKIPMTRLNKIRVQRIHTNLNNFIISAVKKNGHEPSKGDSVSVEVRNIQPANESFINMVVPLKKSIHRELQSVSFKNRLSYLPAFNAIEDNGKVIIPKSNVYIPSTKISREEYRNLVKKKLVENGSK